MELRDVLIFVLAFTFAGFRLYQKYRKKNKTADAVKQGENSFPDKVAAEDEYEPYSGK